MFPIEKNWVHGEESGSQDHMQECAPARAQFHMQEYAPARAQL